MVNDLFAAVRVAAESLGYAFMAGNAGAVAGRMDSFPAVWMTPPKLVAATGCEERTDIYRLSLGMMALAGDADQKEVYGILDTDARELCGMVGAADAVVRVYNMKYTPNMKPLTHFAESGITVEFDAELFSYK